MSTSALAVPPAAAAASAMTPNGPETGYESDGWSDSDDEDAGNSSGSANVTSATLSATASKMPKWSMANRAEIPVAMSLDNMIESENGSLNIYRCEASKGMNPTLGFNKGGMWHLTVRCMNSAESVVMRTPDPKNKKMKLVRKENGGILYMPSQCPSIRFKKKCQDIEGKNTGFKLGKGYASYTSGATPMFAFIAVPVIVDKVTNTVLYAREKAVRSPAFHIFSKRQERFLGPKRKRSRKSAEIQKLDSEIQHAATTSKMLEKDLRHLDFVNGAMKAVFQKLRAQLDLVENETVRISLAFALRCSVEPESVSL